MDNKEQEIVQERAIIMAAAAALATCAGKLHDRIADCERAAQLLCEDDPPAARKLQAVSSTLYCTIDALEQATKAVADTL